MPDNVTANPGSGGATFATDEISSVHHPLTKIEFGPDGTAHMVEDATGKRLPVKVGDPLPAGSNNLGSINISGSLPSGSNTIGNVGIDGPLPAGSNTLGNVNAGLRSDAIIVAGTALAPKFAVVSATITGNNTIVAAVSGKKIRVLNYVLVATNPSTARWQSGTGTSISGLMALCSNGVVASGFSPAGHFETDVNTALVLNATSGVTGHIAYVEV